MPRQRVHRRARPLRRQRQGLFGRLGVALSRLLVVLGTAGLAGYGVREMHGVMSAGGVTALQWVFLILFAVNFTWIGFAACQAVIGALRMIVQGRRPAVPASPPPADFKTALLAPVYNEDPASIAANLGAMAEALAERAPGRYAVFILSDTNRATPWIEEERVFARLIAEAPPGCAIFYRHRAKNLERKAGNIADWVTRFGAGYDAMLVLDADSLMAPETIEALTARLAADPGLGLVQTLPAIIGGQSLYARLQQFAGRCYGPVLGHGLAAWHGRSSNFWGHNAIIRTRAFAEAARLPVLRGRPPLGGGVLSHDFVEAAMLRRAGWGVRFDPDLGGSYEEAPPALLDVMVRDRRWAQGNLQHSRFLFARGFTLASRLHLLTGIFTYVSALLWLALVLVGLMIALQAAFTRPEYFAEPSLFPTWPVFDSERALSLFILSMGVVLTPKMLGFVSVLLHPMRCLRFGGPLALSLSLVVETLFSALFAPVMMLAQSQIVREILTGQDSGWQPQRRRDGRIRLGAALRAHLWHMLTGVALAAVAMTLSRDLFYWLLPVTAGMILAGPLSWLSGSRAVGGALQRVAVLRTPEEQRRTRPAILNAARARQDSDAAVEPSGGPLSLLQADAALADWHRAQLPPSDPEGFDPDRILAAAKADRATDSRALEAWLTDAEMLAFLRDPSLVARVA